MSNKKENILSVAQAHANLMLRAFEFRQHVNETLLYILLLKEYRQTDCEFNDKIEPAWIEATAEIAQTKSELFNYLTNNF